MTKAEMIVFLGEVKKTHAAVKNCFNEAKIRGWSGEALKKWNDLLNDFSDHEHSVEKSSRAENYDEKLILDDIVWFRSLARKLDYFSVDQLASGEDLISSADALFVSTL